MDRSDNPADDRPILVRRGNCAYEIHATTFSCGPCVYGSRYEHGAGCRLFDIEIHRRPNGDGSHYSERPMMCVDAEVWKCDTDAEEFRQRVAYSRTALEQDVNRLLTRAKDEFDSMKSRLRTVELMARADRVLWNERRDNLIAEIAMLRGLVQDKDRRLASAKQALYDESSPSSGESVLTIFEGWVPYYPDL